MRAVPTAGDGGHLHAPALQRPRGRLAAAVTRASAAERARGAAAHGRAHAQDAAAPAAAQPAVHVRRLAATDGTGREGGRARHFLIRVLLVYYTSAARILHLSRSCSIRAALVRSLSHAVWSHDSCTDPCRRDFEKAPHPTLPLLACKPRFAKAKAPSKPAAKPAAKPPAETPAAPMAAPSVAKPTATAAPAAAAARGSLSAMWAKSARASGGASATAAAGADKRAAPAAAARQGRRKPPQKKARRMTDFFS